MYSFNEKFQCDRCATILANSRMTCSCFHDINPELGANNVCRDCNVVYKYGHTCIYRKTSTCDNSTYYKYPIYNYDSEDSQDSFNSVKYNSSDDSTQPPQNFTYDDLDDLI
jgi:hypothetical protein